MKIASNGRDRANVLKTVVENDNITNAQVEQKTAPEVAEEPTAEPAAEPEAKFEADKQKNLYHKKKKK